MIKLLLVIYIVLLTSSSVLYNYCCFGQYDDFATWVFTKSKWCTKVFTLRVAELLYWLKTQQRLFYHMFHILLQTHLNCNMWIIFFHLHTGFSSESFGKWYWPGWACAGQYHFLTFLNNWFQSVRVIHMIMCYRTLHQYCVIALSSISCYIPFHPYCVIALSSILFFNIVLMIPSLILYDWLFINILLLAYIINIILWSYFCWLIHQYFVIDSFNGIIFFGSVINIVLLALQ